MISRAFTVTAELPCRDGNLVRSRAERRTEASLVPTDPSYRIDPIARVPLQGRAVAGRTATTYYYYNLFRLRGLIKEKGRVPRRRASGRSRRKRAELSRFFAPDFHTKPISRRPFSAYLRRRQCRRRLLRRCRESVGSDTALHVCDSRLEGPIHPADRFGAINETLSP